jgi:cytochrome b561
MNSTLDASRYDRVSILLHWLIAFALIGEVGFGYLLDAIAPRGTPERAGVINLHKSLGIVLGLLIVARLAWRLMHRPPAWPESMPAWQRRAAELGHWAIYACMVMMPLSGYIASNFSKYGIRFFGTMLGPWGPDQPQVYALLVGVHDVTALLFVALISGHVLMTLKHALIDHDAVFAQMWPAARRVPAAAPSRHTTTLP